MTFRVAFGNGGSTWCNRASRHHSNDERRVKIAFALLLSLAARSVMASGSSSYVSSSNYYLRLMIPGVNGTMRPSGEHQRNVHPYFSKVMLAHESGLRFGTNSLSITITLTTPRLFPPLVLLYAFDFSD